MHFQKTINGFCELLRMKSYEQVGNSAILFRATVEITNGRVTFCTSSSPKAVKLAANEIIVPEIHRILPHAGQ